MRRRFAGSLIRVIARAAPAHHHGRDNVVLEVIVSSVAVQYTPVASERGNAEEAAGRLFAEHSEPIFRYCLRQLGSRSEAEDAVQTTFLYALRALQRNVVPECESAWLTTIAKNVCHSQRRTLARRGPLASDVDLDSIALARPSHGEEELLMGLKDALASMPERQRRALVLREWLGVPSREIACELGMSQTATHALLTRARHSLAHALTAVPRRPALGLNFGSLLFKFKALFVGGTANAVATTVVVTGIAVGGVVAVERAILVDLAQPPTSAALYTYEAETSRGWVSRALPGETRLSRVVIARFRSARTDASAGFGPSKSVAMQTAGRGASSEIAVPMSNPQSPGPVGTDGGSTASEAPAPPSGPSPLPDVGTVEPPRVPGIEPPAGLPSDVPQLPEGTPGLPPAPGLEPPAGLPSDVPQPPVTTPELPPAPGLDPPVEFPSDVPQPPPVDTDPLDELLPDPPAPPALPG